MVFLIGEITGKINKLAIFTHKEIGEGNRRQFILDQMTRYSEFTSEDYSKEKNNGLEIIQQQISKFLEQNYAEQNLEPIYGACFGVAGPIALGSARIERSSFKAIISQKDIKNTLPCKRVPVALLNDMEAIGYGIFLGDGDRKLKTICHENNSVNDKDPRTLMLLSTGLGEAFWYWNKYKGEEGASSFFPSEGGHTDFSDPTSDKNLSQFLEKSKLKEGDNSPVSYEYVLSIDGLCRIYNFLRTTKDYVEEPPELTQLFDKNPIEKHSIQSAPIIIQKATQETNSFNLCKETLDLFVFILGSRAGSLALQYKATGGIFICDNLLIPIEKLRDGTFERAFINKENKFGEDNQNIPVKIFSDPNIVLWGAAKYALERGFISEGKLRLLEI
ncbi:MAG: glucokinase [Crocosphaera sp.]